MYELLRKVPLFASLSDTDLEHLCQLVEEVRLSAQPLAVDRYVDCRNHVRRIGQVR